MPFGDATPEMLDVTIAWLLRRIAYDLLQKKALGRLNAAASSHLCSDSHPKRQPGVSASYQSCAR